MTIIWSLLSSSYNPCQQSSKITNYVHLFFFPLFSSLHLPILQKKKRHLIKTLPLTATITTLGIFCICIMIKCRLYQCNEYILLQIYAHIFQPPSFITNTQKSVAIFIVLVSSCLVFINCYQDFIFYINEDKIESKKRKGVKL